MVEADLVRVPSVIESKHSLAFHAWNQSTCKPPDLKTPFLIGFDLLARDLGAHDSPLPFQLLEKRFNAAVVVLRER